MNYRTGYRFLSLLGQARALNRGPDVFLRNRLHAAAHRHLARLLRSFR